MKRLNGMSHSGVRAGLVSRKSVSGETVRTTVPLSLHSHFGRTEIVEAGIKTIERIQREVKTLVRNDPHGAFEPATIGLRAKPLLPVDLVMEKNAGIELHQRLGSGRVMVIGEESLRNQDLDLSAETRMVVLVDMIDGTDLLQRGLSNWCSAMVFYDCQCTEIVAAFVGLPDEGIYFATKDDLWPFVYRYGSSAPVPVAGPSCIRTLADSAIGYYGQKVGAFCSVARHRELIGFLETLELECATQGKSLKTRIYNFAGNPMAIRMIDGISDSRIDAILELNGQAPHDIVSGAFIAQKAGAIFCNLEGGSVDLNHLLQRPADPKSRIRYILAATEDLSREIRGCLSGLHRGLDRHAPLGYCGLT